MREYTLEQWRAMRASGTAELARLAERRRGARRARPRSNEERAAISRMALVEVCRRAAEGRLVLVAPRTYELRPPRARSSTATSAARRSSAGRS